MPAHWKDWEKAKKDIKEEAASKASAVDEALTILRGAQKASKDNPVAMRCPVCGGVKFKTLNKGTQWVCRSCGAPITRPS
jgi:rubrerythrin